MTDDLIQQAPAILRRNDRGDGRGIGGADVSWTAAIYLLLR